jgi:hypothetical protein
MEKLLINNQDFALGRLAGFKYHWSGWFWPSFSTYYLYLPMDIFSRMIIHWEIHDRENVELAMNPV